MYLALVHTRTSMQFNHYVNKAHPIRPVLLFSKLKNIFVGCFNPEFFWYIMKVNDFQGELNDKSAEPKPLHTSVRLP